MKVFRTSRDSGLVKEETGRASSLDKRRGVSQKPLATSPQCGVGTLTHRTSHDNLTQTWS